MPVKMKFY